MGEPASTGLRERKKERVREQLVEAALELFAKNGYDETTIDDIVQAVDVSRRTFFRYFASKEDVVMAWTDKVRPRMRDALAARPADEPLFDSIRYVFNFLAGVYEAHRTEFVAVERVLAGSDAARGRKHERLAQHARLLGEVIAKRMGMDFERDLAPRLVAGVVVGAVSAAFDTWIAGGAKTSLSRLIEEALAFLDTGVIPGVVASRAAPSPRSKGARHPR